MNHSEPGWGGGGDIILIKFMGMIQTNANDDQNFILLLFDYWLWLLEYDSILCDFGGIFWRKKCKIQKLYQPNNLQSYCKSVVLPLTTVKAKAVLPSSTVNLGDAAQVTRSTFRFSFQLPIQMIEKKKVNTCLNESLRFANPACMAGVRISGPNFKARCGLRKL